MAKYACYLVQAVFIISFFFSVAVRSPYWVVSTDYTSYTVVWACQELFGITGSKFIFRTF